MELKPGYKQTEVGVIPGDWATPELGQILKSMQLGGNYKNSERPTRWPLIKMGNLGRGNIKLEKLDFVDSREAPAVRDRLRDGDVLFNTRNTLELVGKVAIWKEELPEAYFNSNIMRMGFDEQQVSSSKFMNSILNTTRSIISLRGIATGTTSVAAIYSRDLAKVVIPLPSKAEQVAIAEALSDADALIESLNQLIAKKRQIKQGAMQELLTGKRRLYGFSGEWEVKRLGDVASLYQPTTISAHQFSAAGYPVYGANGIVGYFDKFNHSTWQVTVTCRGSTCGTVNRTVDKCWITGNAMVVGCDESTSVSKDFLYYALCFCDLSICITGTGQPQIVRTPLANFDIRIPVELLEQSAIAAILSDMDTELAALESRLAKARQIKQAMMQELLTGRIRLL